MAAVAALLVAFLALNSTAAPARYECAVDPGPPVRVRVVQVAGALCTPIGPELVYRHRGKMASAADIDEDGRLDLLVLVHKATRYDPRPFWRPFVYTLRDGRWVAKWLGSRVGGPLAEAVLVRTPEGVRLLTVEESGDGLRGLTLYHWTGFGFRGEWTGEPAAGLSGLQVSDPDGDGVDEVSVLAAEGRRRYVFRGGGFVPAPERREEGE
jgi:hypothetical protein